MQGDQQRLPAVQPPAPATAAARDAQAVLGFVPTLVSQLTKPVEILLSRGPVYGIMVLGGALVVYTTLAEAGTLGRRFEAMEAPLAVAVVIVGAALSLSGALMQLIENYRIRRFNVEMTQATMSGASAVTQATIRGVLVAQRQGLDATLEQPRNLEAPAKTWPSS